MKWLTKTIVHLKYISYIGYRVIANTWYVLTICQVIEEEAFY